MVVFAGYETMMQKLGKYILAGRLQAVFVTSLLTLLGLVFPVFTYVCSGVVPALVTLRLNALAGLQVIIGSMLLIALIALPMKLNPLVAVVLATGVWIPTWFCANVLRVTADQGRLLLAASGFSLAFVVIMHLMIPDLAAWWSEWLGTWAEQVLQAEGRALLAQRLSSVAPFMTAMVSAGLFVNLVSTLLFSRWWQASLFYKGGFRREFHQLRLPPLLVLVVLAGFVLLLLGHAAPGSLVMDILVLLLFLYFFQGLAAAHRFVEARKLSRGWLIGLYALLFVLPQVILFLSCLGMVDSSLLRKIPARRNDNSAGED